MHKENLIQMPLGFGPGHSAQLGTMPGLWTHSPVLILLQERHATAPPGPIPPGGLVSKQQMISIGPWKCVNH